MGGGSSAHTRRHRYSVQQETQGSPLSPRSPTSVVDRGNAAGQVVFCGQDFAAALQSEGVKDTNGKKRVVMLGSGNFGCAMAQIIGRNTVELSDFEDTVNMYVFEEILKGRKLTEIINTEHENPKYLPGYKLPSNVVAVPDAADAARGADVVVICVPHQFLPRLLASVKDVIKPGAVAVSLIKGHVEIRGGRPVLGSQVILDTLGVETAVMMGANVANEMARGDFCEATLATPRIETGAWLRRIFNRPNFKVTAITDVAGTELCGSLKNVIALAAGFCDGLGLGENSKASMVRCGLLEINCFIRHFYPDAQPDTLCESCGVADLITTSYGGRNRKCAEAFAKNPELGWEQIEKDLLGGQKLQGVSTVKDIWPLIEARRLQRKLPLIWAIYNIAVLGKPSSRIVEFAKYEGPTCPCSGTIPKALRVALLGSGAWGSTISRIVGQNCLQLEEFDSCVKMYVYNETFEGRNLCDVINTDHENTKYLPNFKIPENVVAIADAVETAKDADILLFCVPFAFLQSLLLQVKDVVKPGAVAVSLLRGAIAVSDGQPQLTSKMITEILGIKTSVLSGANIAEEVAAGNFSEATLATSGSGSASLLPLLFHTPFLQIQEVRDVATVDLASGLMCSLVLASGICDGIGLGGNTKAAIIRMGLLDAGAIVKKFFPKAKAETLFESCGVADLIALSFSKAGLHRRCSASFSKFMAQSHRLAAKQNSMRVENWEHFAAQVWEEVVQDETKGTYNFVGLDTLKAVWKLVENTDIAGSLPLVRSLHDVAILGKPPSSLIAFE